MVNHHHGAVMLHKHPVQQADEEISLARIDFGLLGTQAGHGFYVVDESPGVAYAFVEVIFHGSGLGCGVARPHAEVCAVGTLVAVQHGLPSGPADRVAVERNHFAALEEIGIGMIAYVVREEAVNRVQRALRLHRRGVQIRHACGIFRHNIQKVAGRKEREYSEDQ